MRLSVNAKISLCGTPESKKNVDVDDTEVVFAFFLQMKEAVSKGTAQGILNQLLCS
jgi:hypothetical protein